jgi:hypothetical protein
MWEAKIAAKTTEELTMAEEKKTAKKATKSVKTTEEVVEKKPAAKKAAPKAEVKEKKTEAKVKKADKVKLGKAEKKHGKKYREAEKLVEFDEGVGSRIIQMCKSYTIIFEGQENNYRLRGIV